jgi:hypothetical protein
MSTKLPPVKGTVEITSIKVKSLVAIRRELKEHISSTLEEAEDPRSWAYQKLSNALKVHDAERKAKVIEASKGTSFVEENKVHALRRHFPGVRLQLQIDRVEKEKEHAEEVWASAG